MLKRLLFILSTLFFTSHTLAEVSANNLYIPFGLMYYNLDSDRGIQNTIMPELGIGYRINDKWATEVIYAMGKTGSTRPGGTDVDFSQARIDVLHFCHSWKGLVPYSLVGIGNNNYEPDLNDDDTVVHIGAGVLKTINNNWSARADIRGIHSLEENQSEYAVNLMVQYQFGAPSSKMAVIEKTPAPAPMPVKVAATKPVSNDDDHDGVINSKDACPDTAAQVAVDSKGCQVMLTEKVEISLSVNFDTNSAVVKPQYDNEIQRVADFMKKYPDTKATIEGHTDDRGDAKYNQKLSESRANAIRKVLIETYGANAAHLTAVGYGESKPIADNKTHEGQLKNRRVIASFESTK